MSASQGHARVTTLGCRLNLQESEAIGAALGDREDLLVVNSCAVTAEAVRQSRQAIRRLRRDNPSAKIAVTGCAAQVDIAGFAAMPEVDHVVGNAGKLRAGTWADLPASDRVVAPDVMAARDVAVPALDHFEGRVRGFVQVQNGCDHRCTFCIIPFGRGPSRSASPEDAVAQVRRLVDTGYREVVLTGVDLTSFGSDLAGLPRLGTLVRRILRDVPELPRLRLSSIDSIEADDDLLRAIAEEERLMPHLHLSLQSGDDLILKRMKRRHTRADAIALCEEARRRRPDIVFGADLIAAFPTETDAMFETTLRLIGDCGIVHLHAFPFSPRPGTPAARMPQLPAWVVRERAARLREAGRAALSSHLDREIGQTRSALVEHGGIARTEHFLPLRLAEDTSPGRIVRVVPDRHDGRVMAGRLAA
jgi:threonylcarbamoyladenosine tRNA methylthiotransferase MtaB